MPIFKALGLGILMLVLSALAPEVLSEGKETVIAFLRGARISAVSATSLVAGVGNSGTPHPMVALPKYPLPQARQITSY